MQPGAITGYVDVAQLVLYAFWIFFAGLIFYLRQEDKREGYPLESDRSARIKVQGFPPVPSAKVFTLPHGGTVAAPSGRVDSRELRAEPSAPWLGAPLQPTGDPMLDGVGPAAYAERAERPDLTVEGNVKIVPLRSAPDFFLEPRDPDPRGMEVVAADGERAGTVRELWVDRSEAVVRYLEVEVSTPSGSRNVLLPGAFARISARRRQVSVESILARHFATVPALANADQVTLREEDRLAAYYASGHLYAKASRMGPIL